MPKWHPADSYSRWPRDEKSTKNFIIPRKHASVQYGLLASGLYMDAPLVSSMVKMFKTQILNFVFEVRISGWVLQLYVIAICSYLKPAGEILFIFLTKQSHKE